MASETVRRREKRREELNDSASAALVDETCLACGEALTGRFCSACGQKKALPIRLERILQDGFGQIASLDSSLLNTLVELSRNPGKVCRDYVEGRRIVYFNPLKYLFFTASIFVVLVTFLGALPPGLPDDPEQIRNFRIVLGAIAYTSFLTLWLSSFLQRILFRKEPYLIAEIYVAQLYLTGHYMIIAALIALAGFYGDAAGQAAIRIGGWIYFVWGTCGFYRRKNFSLLAKATFVYAAHTFLSILAGVTLILAVR